MEVIVMLKEIKEIGQRGVIFQYEDQNLVYLIKGDKRLYLCDTHLGNKSMQVVKDYINDKGYQDKELVIFNSHSDYDHIWGNGVFADNLIIAHQSALDRFKIRGEYDLEMKNDFKNGEVKLAQPNLTFVDRLYFADDEIEFVYAPGHTIDSAICIDKKDSTVYVGDLVETPIPMIFWEDLDGFIKTLKYLKNIQPKRYIASHSGIVNKKDINGNLDYLQKLNNCEEQNFKHDGINRIHKFNKKNILMQQFEKMARDKSKGNFNYKDFKRNFWNELGVESKDLNREFDYLLATGEEKLKNAFKRYISGI